MRNLIRKCWYLTAVALLCFAAGAFAQNTANMALTSAGSNVLNGVFVGPYTATIGNTTGVQVICDDWADSSYIGETWTAYVNTLQPLSNPSETKWGNNQLLYDQAAWLVTKMLSPGTTCPNTGNCVGDISYALWELTYCSVYSCPSPTTAHTPFASLSGNDLTNAQWWLSQAQGMTLASFTPGEFANFTIYTPLNGGPPQEFLRVPESPAAVLLGVDLLALVGLIVVFRRRMVRAAN
jgi:hypothetical protein